MHIHASALRLSVDTSLGSGRVTRVLERLIEERGQPQSVRSDNRPKFTSRRMLGWAEERKIALVHIQPGRPMQNGHVESFPGRLRDECLNVSWFRTLNEVRRRVDAWRQEYNSERPRSSLAYKTPREFAASRGYTHLKNKAGKLQLSLDEKNGAGHGSLAPRLLATRRPARGCCRCLTTPHHTTLYALLSVRAGVHRVE